MPIGILEYADTNTNDLHEPVQDREAIESIARTYREQQEVREAAAALKESISQQLEQGNAPQYILYTAIKAIGLLTNDTEWAETQHKALGDVYADLAQQSFIVDNATIAADRLDKMQRDYIDKMRRQLTKSLNGYKRIEKALIEALQAVNGAEGAKDPGTPEDDAGR